MNARTDTTTPRIQRALAAWLACAAATCVAPPRAVAGEVESFEERCEREVVELHQFLEAWSNAELPATDEAFARFDRAIAADFTIVSPTGGLDEREAIVGAVRRAYGRWSEAPGRIEIRNFRFHAASGELAVVTYEEWHHLPGGGNGRLSSAALRLDPEAPAGLQWVHLSEVWLEPSG